MKQTVKVLFRKTGSRKQKRIIAFFPEATVNFGNIMSYEHIGQHSEAAYEFYLETKKAKPEEYEELLEELRSVYSDYKLEIKSKLYVPDLQKAWRKATKVEHKS